MTIESVRISQQARDHLIRMKSRTGIQNWNVLCRWAFCLSLAEPSVPAYSSIKADSSVEMTWRTFGGVYHAVYAALLRERCILDGLGVEEYILEEQFKLHLHRGIGYLFGNRSIQGIQHLIDIGERIRTGPEASRLDSNLQAS